MFRIYLFISERCSTFASLFKINNADNTIFNIGVEGKGKNF